jgi:proteic killer suppression protein
MIKSFRHGGLEQFFRKGSKGSIQPQHANRLRLQLGRLDSAISAEDMNLPGWRWHPLKGDLAGCWAVWWMRTGASRKFEGKDAVLVDYQDYH